MEIRTIWKGFEAFEFKFEPFEKDSKLSKPNYNHSKKVRSTRMHIITIRKRFEAFQCKFEPFERNSKHSNVNSNYSKVNSKLFEKDTKFEPFKKGIQSFRNPTSNHSKGIRTIQMQILTIRMRDSKAFKSKF